MVVVPASVGRQRSLAELSLDPFARYGAPMQSDLGSWLSSITGIHISPKGVHVDIPTVVGNVVGVATGGITKAALVASSKAALLRSGTPPARAAVGPTPGTVSVTQLVPAEGASATPSPLLPTAPAPIPTMAPPDQLQSESFLTSKVAGVPTWMLLAAAGGFLLLQKKQ